jgi:hypothetical protein
MPLESGGRIYRSNVCNDIKSKLDGFVDRRTTPGAVLLKELLQNADDAGARELHVLLDLRAAPEDAARLGGELAGPGLLVVNYGPFEDAHFEAIRTVASGNKLDDTASFLPRRRVLSSSIQN